MGKEGGNYFYLSSLIINTDTVLEPFPCSRTAMFSILCLLSAYKLPFTSIFRSAGVFSLLREH